MIQLHKSYLQRFTWFVAGLLCTVLFSVVPSIWQPATAVYDGNTVAYHSTSFVAPSFEEVADSHLEPNFYH